MDEFAIKFADKLEEYAGKARTLTVDRVSKALTLTAMGLVVAFLASIALVFLIVALFRLIAEFTTVEWAYAILGGLFTLAGALVWRMRNNETQ